MLHVCSLAELHPTVSATGASHVLTIMANVAQVERPRSVLEANHLRVQVDDITEAMDGFVVPSDTHVAQVLDFVRAWDRRSPMVIHCYAGISRSTASAFAAACLLNPDRDEVSIARHPPARRSSDWDTRSAMRRGFAARSTLHRGRGSAGRLRRMHLPSSD